MQILLNAAPPSTLAAIVPARSDERSESRWADELRAIGPISWWDRPGGAIDDIRERFAREIPLAPIDPDALLSVRRWLAADAPTGRALEVPDESDLAPIDGPREVRSAKVAAAEPLSAIGGARWAVLNALTVLSRDGIDPEGRWRQIVGWAEGELPIGRLGLDDRRRAVAWLVFRADSSDDRDLPQVAAWLRRQGLDSAEEVGRWTSWSRDLDGLAPAADLESARVMRVRFVGALRDALRGEARSGRGMA